MEHIDKTAKSRFTSRYVATPWLWEMLAVTTVICIGLTSECLALTASPTTLTFDAIQGDANPPDEPLWLSL